MLVPEMAAIFCITTAVYHESRGEPDLGKTAVAHVVMNRSKRYNSKPCGVVWHKHQFSNVRVPSKEIRTTKDWKVAEVIATKAFYGESKDPTKGATHFHAWNVAPYWSKKLKHKVTIGNHIFYR